MPLALHLSDLHLFANPREQEVIFEGLVAAARHVRGAYDSPVGLLAITGDVFDSSTLDPERATERFVELHQELCRALGSDVPTVIVPGNHDRRKNGLFGPHRDELFQALQRALGARAWVHGCNLPFLSAVIPPSYHGLPLWIVAYDSTYLPQGLISAGGALRQEDLLYAAAQIGSENPDWPVVCLLHHHLVPTPLTDLEPIELDGRASGLVRWGVTRLLPELIANADREELTMTALGAGTALSTLHTLGRAVIAIHGHKHYATARLLVGTMVGQGDVLLVSAGSAGLAQRWDGGGADTARLWPSFNVIELEGDSVSIDTLSFAWKREAESKHARRALVRARRIGSNWLPQPVTPWDVEDQGPRLSVNTAECRLVPSSVPGRWDYACRRELRSAEGGPRSYAETVEGLSDGTLVHGESSASAELPAIIHLNVDGEVRYRVQGGVFRTLSEASRAAKAPSPFAQIALLNRYASETCRLTVAGLGPAAGDAFASATDLGTGLERPMPLEPGARPNEVSVSYARCPPRLLLRIYWPLERDEKQ